MELKNKIPPKYQEHLNIQQPISQDLEGIPIRGILLGAVLAFLLNFLDAYATTIIRGSYLPLNFSTSSAAPSP